MRVFGGLVVLLVALTVSGVAAGVARAEPSQQELLLVTGELTYDVRPDDGPVTVTWQVTVSNNDPATTYRDFGFITFYEGVVLPVLRGASGLRATGPGGVALTTGIEDPGEPVLVIATVAFDRNLFYGDSYSFTLTYELDRVQSEFLLVSAHYAFLPAISLGDSSVRVLTPVGAEWNVTVEDGQECEAAGPGEYHCRGDYEATQLAALVEVSRPAALESRRTEVHLEEQTLDVTIRYFPDQQDWAQQAEALSQAALPILEELFGFAYDSAQTLEVAQSGRRDVFGYEGVFSCSTQLCSIGVSPLAGDHVLLHELAHAWTEAFADRWLQEGFAEFMAQRVEEQLGDLVAPFEQPLVERPFDFPLESWGPATYLLNATDEQRERELSGYADSVEFLEELQRRIGLGGLQAAVGEIEGRARVDSRRFLDLLEEATGERLDELFRERVFLPNSAALLEERRAARDRFDELQQAVEDAGLELPSRISALNRSWLFDRANAVMRDAEIALERLTEARDRVEDSRSFWQRIGLLGADPEGEIDEAVRAFSRGDYAGSNQHAEAAADAIDGANRSAMIRVLVALGAAVAIGSIVGAVAVLVLRKRRRRPA